MSSPLVMAGFTPYSNLPTLLPNLSLQPSQFSCRGPLNCAWQASQLAKHRASCTSPAGCCPKQQRLYRLAPFKYLIKHFCGLTRWAPRHFQKIIFSGSGSTFPCLGPLLFPPHSVPPLYLRVMTFLSHCQRSILSLSTAP